MDDYISKPVRQSDLASVLDKWLSSSSAPANEYEEAEAVVEDVLDHDRWAELQNELDAELVQELVSLFLAEVPPLLLQLQESVEISDFQEVRSIAHKLKGSCATMGVARMAALCRDIENCVAADVPMGLNSLVERLASEFTVAHNVLENKEAV